MKKIMTLLIFFVSTFWLIACQNQSIEKIDADTAISMLSNNDAIVLLDVREYNEYITERIEGSTLLSLSILESRIEERFPDKETSFIVYCNSGRRSAEAIEIMLELGYSNIVDLGGIIDWPYETVSGPIS